ASIDWGDGGHSEGRLAQNGVHYDVTAAHTYQQPGTYRIRTVITLGPKGPPGQPAPVAAAHVVQIIDSTATVSAMIG
ncbi:MAG: hypothetical protein ACHRHE_12855, partial [Tepidisphaerales bacterium]